LTSFERRSQDQMREVVRVELESVLGNLRRQRGRIRPTGR
jgi:hypothetical protein